MNHPKGDHDVPGFINGIFKRPTTAGRQGIGSGRFAACILTHFTHPGNVGRAHRAHVISPMVFTRPHQTPPMPLDRSKEKIEEGAVATDIPEPQSAFPRHNRWDWQTWPKRGEGWHKFNAFHTWSVHTCMKCLGSALHRFTSGRLYYWNIIIIRLYSI